MGHGGKDRHARAQHNAGAALVSRQPTLQSLRPGHAAVHRDHACIAKSGFHARLKLRREIDLWHHHQGLCVGVFCQTPGNRLKVDLGFAAASGAMQKKRARCLSHLRQHLGLLF